MLSKIRHVPPEELQSIPCYILIPHDLWLPNMGTRQQRKSPQNRKTTKQSSTYHQLPRTKNRSTTSIRRQQNPPTQRPNQTEQLSIHDYLHDLLPDCFQNYYLPLNSLFSTSVELDLQNVCPSVRPSVREKFFIFTL